MSPSRSARRTTRRSPRVLAATVLLVVVAAAAVALTDQAPAPPTRPALSAAAGSPPDVLGREDRAPVGEADGVLPAGATVSDDDLPGVAHLDPALLGALRRAAADAGMEFRVTSGWRSPEYQEQLLREAVAEHGSEEEAARWVATAETSAHVSGDAVDIGPAEATAWLSENGAEHGLCQVYANEPWHYELRPEAIGDHCPRMYDDPTQDPRTHR
ncbi:M15 family metallopeptidase [Modestobacter altitudinis]|uniref:M15 family metallopeptidase n=1 Tax=Modestobacter altitudinis TaxID=2213158 RepID=UPI00110CAA43|nr:M15 family metallopeptidase [Modestobacter altitudinis]